MNTVDLPEPSSGASTSVEAAIATRASRRSFADEAVSLDTVAQLLWAVQGVTHERDGVDMRAAPSAGATFPLVADLEVAPGGCVDLDPGLYRYDPDQHALERRLDGPIHDELAAAALDQPVVVDSPAVVALSADYSRTTGRYPDHGERYVHMEAGHAAQNLHLVCEARGLGSCPVGAFDDEALADVLALEAVFEPLYLLPFGHRPADSV
ncbi:SagB/ThcOx family dehydrogenase [Halapricum hydrolyticum]|uniref:SagB/ThcOx family dehydrogenase n=1 Tax=Halapricum hydrolyticum TaxID=2979991 RepID=A0AAE3IE62_9EURY|nr:SagB/ThcOx family dehydrogenase [Halapricum hydrolyticum]MCU4717686.1 SagB/ThcOx family dehydrogenase [Halapricum hydrolyticum]MCU4726785.1 SagB/ThcOx family dehydrogenase [Halapricum hydrolyticum]